MRLKINGVFSSEQEIKNPDLRMKGKAMKICCED
jgi:hypothetical protein